MISLPGGGCQSGRCKEAARVPLGKEKDLSGLWTCPGVVGWVRSISAWWPQVGPAVVGKPSPFGDCLARTLKI